MTSDQDEGQPINTKNRPPSHPAMNGSSQILHKSIRDDLIRSYVHYVHPQLPVIDLEELAAPVRSDEVYRAMSRLLYHAMMCAVVPYIDMQHLSAQGYCSRGSAHRDHLQHAQILLDRELDVGVTRIQSILLITHRHDLMDKISDVDRLLGIAYDDAQKIGINSTRHQETLTAQERNLRKMIWGCLYMRDTITAFTLRRSVRICNQNQDLSEPLVLDPLTISKRHTPYTTLTNSTTSTDIYKQILMLCRLLRDEILSTMDTASTKTVSGKIDTPRPDVNQIFQYDQAIRRWKGSLPAHLQCRGSVSREENGEPLGGACAVHQIYINDNYLAILNAIHQPHKDTKEGWYSRQTIQQNAQESIQMHASLSADDAQRVDPTPVLEALTTLEEETEQRRNLKGDAMLSTIHILTTGIGSLQQVMGLDEIARERLEKCRKSVSELKSRTS